MQFFNQEYINNSVKPYVADLGIALAFGVGCLLFKSIKNKANKKLDSSKLNETNKNSTVFERSKNFVFNYFKDDIKIKDHIKQKINKWSSAKSLQKFNYLIINNNDKNVSPSQIIKNIQDAELIPDITTYNCLLMMSNKLNQTKEYNRLLDDIFKDFTTCIEPDVVTCNIVLKHIVRTIKETILSYNVDVNYSTYKDSDCYKIIFELIKKAENLKNDMHDRCLTPDDVTYNTILDCYVEAGMIDKAVILFNELLDNLKVYKNLVIENKKNNIEIAKEFKKILPDNYTYTTIIKGLKNGLDKEESYNYITNIYKNIIDIDFINNENNYLYKGKIDEYIVNSVIDAYIKLNKINEAYNIFLNILKHYKDESIKVKPSLITFSIILKGLAIEGRLQESFDIINNMKVVYEIKPNEIAYDCLINCAAKNKDIQALNKIYSMLKEDNISPNNNILCSLVKAFNKTKNFNLAFQLYDNLSTAQLNKLDIVFFNCLLDCCVESGNIRKMHYVYNYIEDRINNNINKSQDNEEVTSLIPSVITYSTILKGYIKSDNVEETEKLYYKVLTNDNKIENYNAYNDSNYLSNIKGDEIFFNIMADFYAKKQEKEKTLEVFETMKKLSVIKSSIIYSIIIKMFSNINDKENAIKFYNLMKQNGHEPNLIIYTTIMQMYIKLKNLDKAIDIFYEMKQKNITIDIVSYNFIINGCCFNKKLEKAIEILLISLDQNIKLSENTYNNVIEYLLNNKFMSNKDRSYFSKILLKKFKEKNKDIDYNLYSKLVKIIYNENNTNNKSDVSDKYTHTNYKNENKYSKIKSYNNNFYNKFKKTYKNFNTKSYNNFKDQIKETSIYDD